MMLAGCGGGGDDETSQTATRRSANPTPSVSPQFQQFERSHFGFFRAAGSYPYVSELGVHWQRPHPGPFVWGMIEASPGTYDWSQADQFVRDAQEARILLAATIWPYADWDQQRCHARLPGAPFSFLPTLGDYRGKPCDPDAYRLFVTTLVERYDGDGVDDMPGLALPIKYWEVINEPEPLAGTPFFVGDPQDADYLQMLMATSQYVKFADPDAKVLNGGIAWLRDEKKTFWEAVLAEGARFIDVLTIHAVPAPDDLNLASLQVLMDELGLEKPVWVTEIHLAPRRGGSSANTVEEQERWSALLVRDFTAAFGRGADKLFYLGLDNATPTAPAALLVNCSEVVGGELEEDHLQLGGCQKQKAFYAFQTIVDKIDYFEEVEQLNEGQYKFTVEGRPVYVLWGDRPLPAEIGGKVRLTDIFGAAKEVDAAEINLTDSPVYIEQI